MPPLWRSPRISTSSPRSWPTHTRWAIGGGEAEHGGRCIRNTPHGGAEAAPAQMARLGDAALRRFFSGLLGLLRPLALQELLVALVGLLLPRVDDLRVALQGVEIGV